MADEGLILVWDMDQTIISDRPFIWNNNALNLIKRAVLSKPKVTAIFLLTNNPNDPFIDAITDAITDSMDFPDEMNIMNVFDGIMSATDPTRIPSTDPRYPPGGLKRLEDIMMLMMRKRLPFNPATLKDRVYFFDDLPNHVLKEQLPEGHYIQIVPPFSDTSIEDKTDYRSVLAALNSNEGGKRKKKVRKTKKLRRYTRSMGRKK
jgi:hypothetical protein